MDRLLRLVLMSSLLCLTCCVRQGGCPETVLRPLAVSEEIDDLAPFVSDIEIIPVADDSNCFRGVKKMLPSEDSFFILSGGAVFRVSSDGKEVSKIGETGRGPGEYIQVEDICFNRNHDELLCLDADCSVLRFDSSTGKCVGKIKLADQYVNPSGIFPVNEDQFGLYFPNPATVAPESLHSEFQCIHFFDYDGKEKGSALPWEDFNFSSAFSSSVSFNWDDCYIVSPGFSPRCYMFDGTEEYSLLTLDFGRKNVPFRYALKNGKDPWTKLPEIFESDFYKGFSSIFKIGDGFYLSAYGKRSALWNFVIFSNLESGICWQSKGTSVPPQPAVACKDACLFFVYDSLSGAGNSEDILENLVRSTVPAVPDGTVFVKVRFDEIRK
ncbi:MAG: 6-bladed beta-propeller [Bacteroidales bacterium]|nr:6-bladed beta-propeller [Bacteroidales bacterium]